MANESTGISCGSCASDNKRVAVEAETGFSDAVYLLLLMIVGLALRLDFVLPVDSVIDADEAIVGLMASHILHGSDIPTFYYGQHYMGSLESILTAGMFALFGENNFSLKLTPLVFSIALIPIIFLLTKQYAGRFAAKCAALLMAIPPVSLVVWSAKARGGFIEILFIGALALYFVGQLFLECRAGRFRPGYLVAAAFSLGVGWWVNNQIVFFFLPVALITLASLNCADRRSIADYVKYFFIGLAAFLVGGAPFWVYNVRHKFISFQMFGAAQGSSIADHLTGLFSISIPILIGSKSFWDTRDIFPDSTLIFSAAYVIVLVAALWSTLRRRSISTARDPKLSPSFLFIFVIFTLAIFTFSSFGYLVQAPRYLLPSYVGLFALSAIGIETIAARFRFGAFVLIGALAAQNLVSAYHEGRAVPGEPMIFNGDRVALDHAPLINFLEQNHISLIRTNYWVGYRLAFETGEKIKFVVYQQPRSVRLPEYEQNVSREDKAFIPLVLSPKQADIVNHGLHSMGYEFKRASVGGYEIFYDIHDREPGLNPLSPKLISIKSNYHNDASPLMLDGDPLTRWGSAHPQTTDMYIELSFREPVALGGVILDYDGFETDYARKLELKGYDIDDHEVSLFSETDYHYSIYATGGASRLRLAFPLQKLKRLVLRQTGEDPVLDWSLTEITPLTR